VSGTPRTRLHVGCSPGRKRKVLIFLPQGPARGQQAAIVGSGQLNLLEFATLKREGHRWPNRLTGVASGGSTNLDL